MKPHILTLLITIGAFTNTAHAADPVIGCYDQRPDKTNFVKYPPLRFTNTLFDYSGHHWRRIVSLDPARPMPANSLWFRDHDGVHLYFEPPDMTNSGNFRVTMTMHETAEGLSGDMQAATEMGTQIWTVNLDRRPCK